ncbi:DUF3093 domain-containing protein [Leifsonia sp. A12D58]|uniref:DUF3093 domain-containing protein n=1 Tax=Leifsonia sp. A12D58 TaxID=3397674 RepID=UPI0039DF7928
MPAYREKLWPTPWIFIFTALVIPASMLVFAPISALAGIITAVILYGGCVVILTLTSPVITVADGVLTAGNARIRTEMLGEPEVYEGAEATAQRGTQLDARAWLLIRGWVQPVVRLPILDPNDPAPYWLISTRQPKKLAAAINGSRRPTV